MLALNTQFTITAQYISISYSISRCSYIIFRILDLINVYMIYGRLYLYPFEGSVVPFNPYYLFINTTNCI